MIQIPENRGLVCFDVDSTLVEWFPTDAEFEIDGYPMAPMIENIRMLKTMKTIAKRTILVWSQSGVDHVEKVINKLQLGDFVDFISAKPIAYVDDYHCTDWIGPNLYRKKGYKKDDDDDCDFV